MRPVLKLTEHCCAKLLPVHFLVDLWHLWHPHTTATLVQNLLDAILNFIDRNSRRARGNCMCLHNGCIQVICSTEIKPWSKHSLISREKDRWLLTYLKTKHGSCWHNTSSKMWLSCPAWLIQTLSVGKSHGNLRHLVTDLKLNFQSLELFS